jgi:hypothetical protein
VKFKKCKNAKQKKKKKNKRARLWEWWVKRGCLSGIGNNPNSFFQKCRRVSEEESREKGKGFNFSV